ncbi:MAG: transketolase family protein [Gemmatimonadetes bacterium]|nr:transketolase family protein [Gemmatimonadota bacterium]
MSPTLATARIQNPREVYGRTLVELGRADPRVVVLEGDLGKSTMTCYFEETFPERFFEMGIGEANMTSFAAGLALTGKIPFTNSFAVFAAGRAYDQIRMGVCVPKLNVKIVGSSAGLSDFGDGSSHQTVDDVAIMRVLPHMTVLVPADAIEVRKMVYAAVAHPGPVYIRITRNDLPDVTREHEPFVIGRPGLIRDGSDVVIFAMGQMVSEAVRAADALAAEGSGARVVNVSTLKPVDEAALIALARGFRGIVTAEEHSLIGGLASVVTWAFRNEHIPVRCVGIEDRWGQSAHSYAELQQEYGLTAGHVAAQARAVLND